jgi:hypothetical protein
MNHFLRKMQLTIAGIGVAFGVVAVFGDALFVWQYGADFNDAAFILGNGEFVDWPTGEPPLYAYIPAAGYGLAAWLISALLLVLHPGNVRRYFGRIRRGCE